jgi:flagellar biosynthesis/type III secretory pathway M-ring protein FliF/YscJ
MDLKANRDVTWFFLIYFLSFLAKFLLCCPFFFPLSLTNERNKKKKKKKKKKREEKEEEKKRGTKNIGLCNILKQNKQAILSIK